jgi:hypothetical protein
MTSPLDLKALEHQIKEKRERLARDLEHLRSPETMSQVKSELLGQAAETADDLVNSARGKLSAGMQEIWREAKARAAANPAAALALGAGVAWRLIQRPPVASALVGIGLISLWRTDPRYPAPGADLAARSGELLEAAKQRAHGAAEELQIRTGQVRSAASDLMESAAETVGNAVQAGQAALEDARQTGERVIPPAAERAKAVVDRAVELTSSDKERDQILLGAAALALAAALGIAVQRRSQ